MNKKTVTIKLYGRPGCHLCDQVYDMLERVGQDIRLNVEQINIEEDPELHEKYMFTIPVVEIVGGRSFPSVEAIVTEEQIRAEIFK